ncbi:tuzin [Trypanosoma cruzi]|uniref:Tuzin n=1 Tax=Trypanosoma cruzi TaxID=5693 RepID=A0A2V2V0D5_TRYCR|nr:tuzin [Trypanosoma cruzi]
MSSPSTVASSVPAWPYWVSCLCLVGILKNYKKQQRSYQLAIAASALSQPHSKRPIRDYVHREDEEQRLRQTLRQQDLFHPRILVFAGFYGCGKSILFRSAIRKEKMAAVFVDIRPNEDPLRSIVKSLNVQNIDACGDLLNFIGEASDRARKAMHGVTPLFVLKIRDGQPATSHLQRSLWHLACDRRLCHVIIEVPIESLTIAMTAPSTPRLPPRSPTSPSRRPSATHTT